MSISLQEKQQLASTWFENIRTRICDALETIEREISSQDAQTFTRTAWQRQEENGGGGIMAVLKGGVVFEKAGVNVSTVHGTFSEEFRKKIPGADEDGHFWASGVSLVIHPRSPLVPTVHMNTRMIVTSKLWFGGGADLTPMGFPVETDTADFHAAFQDCCLRHPESAHYEEFRAWCDRYFYLPHRQRSRGVGGIFYDDLNSGNWDRDFAFTKDVGETFLKIYPEIVRRHYKESWSEEDRAVQLNARGRYAEFNLIYDRGTKFGLQTGGNTEAILMSLPPVVTWD